MEKLRDSLQVSFSTRVIVPVVATMVLLMAITVWILNNRVTQQFQGEAVRSLARADAEFQSARKARIRNLAHLKNLANEPRYVALLQSENAPTIADQFYKNLPQEQSVDVALFTSASRKVVARVKGDPEIAMAEFESKSARAIACALRGEETLDTFCAGERVFDIISIPVNGRKGGVIGTLTFGSEIRNNDVREFRVASQSE